MVVMAKISCIVKLQNNCLMRSSNALCFVLKVSEFCFGFELEKLI